MTPAPTTRFTIVGIGEALFDSFPDHRQLGGAPLNLALAAHQLARPHGGRGVIVSRVGQDDPGTELLDILRARGLTTDYIQTDPDRPTGMVAVDFDPQNRPTYDILPGAWDVLQFDPDLEDLATTCAAVAFGTLAQRDGQGRNTIYRFLDAARRAVKLFDVNLRQNFFDRRTVTRSCEYATIVKLNEDELPIVAELTGLTTSGAQAPPLQQNRNTPAIPEAAPLQQSGSPLDDLAMQLRKRFNLEMVALTRGQRGTRLFTADAIITGAPVHYDSPPSGADPVGAGDAAAAAILVARVLRRPKQQIADLANRCGAFTASQPGATPTFPDDLINPL